MDYDSTKDYIGPGSSRSSFLRGLFRYTVVGSVDFNRPGWQHDREYRRGGDSVRRLNSDLAFYNSMVSQIRSGNLWMLQRVGATAQANVYYYIVRTLGWMFWNYK